jgi:hypothetical protein
MNNAIFINFRKPDNDNWIMSEQEKEKHRFQDFLLKGFVKKEDVYGREVEEFINNQQGE